MPVSHIAPLHRREATVRSEQVAGNVGFKAAAVVGVPASMSRLSGLRPRGQLLHFPSKIIIYRKRWSAAPTVGLRLELTKNVARVGISLPRRMVPVWIKEFSPSLHLGLVGGQSAV
jgi:hypothetical protein